MTTPRLVPGPNLLVNSGRGNQSTLHLPCKNSSRKYECRNCVKVEETETESHCFQMTMEARIEVLERRSEKYKERYETTKSQEERNMEIIKQRDKTISELLKNQRTNEDAVRGAWNNYHQLQEEMKKMKELVKTHEEVNACLLTELEKVEQTNSQVQETVFESSETTPKVYYLNDNIPNGDSYEMRETSTTSPTYADVLKQSQPTKRRISSEYTTTQSSSKYQNSMEDINGRYKVTRPKDTSYWDTPSSREDNRTVRTEITSTSPDVRPQNRVWSDPRQRLQEGNISSRINTARPFTNNTKSWNDQNNPNSENNRIISTDGNSVLVNEKSQDIMAWSNSRYRPNNSVDNKVQRKSPTCPNNKDVTKTRDKIPTQYGSPRTRLEWEKPEKIEVRVGGASQHSNNRQQNITRVWYNSRNNKNQEYERGRIEEEKQCVYHKLGICKFGEKCWYSHENGRNERNHNQRHSNNFLVDEDLISAIVQRVVQVLGRKTL